MITINNTKNSILTGTSNSAKKYVISIGGSKIAPDFNKKTIDIEFSKKLKQFTHSIKNPLILVCGGGDTARKYQNALRSFTKSKNNLDWMGISATRLNAEFIKHVLNISKPVITNPNKIPLFPKNKILVAAGWKPGWSTDYVTVLIAHNSKAIAVNITDVPYIYDKDPARHKNAKPFKDMTWEEYKKVIPTTWKPGLKTPFDPRASKLAEKYNMTVLITNSLTNVKNYIKGKPFKGTVIHP